MGTRTYPLLLALLLVSTSILGVPQGSLSEAPPCVSGVEGAAPLSLDDGVITVVSVEYPDELYPFNYSDVLVLINNNSQMSRQVGEYFVEARDVPDENVAYLDVPAREIIYMEEFDDLKAQVKDYMTEHDLVDKINYIVTTKGFPLKTRVPGTNMNHVAYYYQACVDEEIALFFSRWENQNSNYGAVANPYYNNRSYFSHAEQEIFLVNRLTGYDWDDVKGIIDRANDTMGNRGLFVLDVDPTRDNAGYRMGNDWLRNARDILVDRGEDVLFDDTRWYVVGQEDVIGYASWGSNDGNDTDHAKPHNTWVNGSIAETFVSTGGRTFTPPPRYGQSLVADWIKEGVTGIKGYVWEPFLSAIAHPDILFERYTAGFNLAECYRMASTMLSWMGVVVGDPKCAAYRDVPDLHIDSSRLSVSNLTPATGDPFELYVVVDNLGGRAENVSVTVEMDDAPYLVGKATFDTFGRTTIAIPVTAPVQEGVHKLTVHLNFGGDVFETRMDDNKGETGFTSKERPVITLTAYPLEVLTEESIRFTITLVRNPRPITLYFIDFGDGESRTLTGGEVYHAYLDDGVYNVSAYVIDESMVLSKIMYVDVTVLNRGPVASIRASLDSIRTFDNVSLNASGSYDDDGEVVSVSWDLGDGNTSEAWELEHSYERPGAYEVRLTVKDDDGAFSSTMQVVTVLNRPPVASLVRQGGSIYKGRPVTLDASGSTDVDGRVVQFDWRFGDGTSGDVTTSPWVIHSFPVAGEATVTLTVFDDWGAYDTVELVVEVINLQPMAFLTVEPTTLLTNDIFQMDASGSYDDDGELVEYVFQVTKPDGYIDEVARGDVDNARFRPRDDGLYWVNLTVIDDDGAHASLTALVTVLNRGPKAAFDVDTSSLGIGIITAPRLIQVAVEASDPDGTIASVNWTVTGEGHTAHAEGVAVQFTLERAGQFEIIVRVADDDGATVSLSMNVTVNEVPKAAFSAHTEAMDLKDARIYPDTVITFDASMSTDTAGDTLEYHWDFGDGYVQHSSVAVHSFLEPGSYSVTLTVTDPHGEADTQEMVVTVLEQPEQPDDGLTTVAKGAIAAIVVVVAIVCALVVYYHHARKQEDSGGADV